MDNTTCIHCDKVAEWFNPKGMPICQRCMVSLAIYQDTKLHDYTLIRHRANQVPEITFSDEIRLGQRKLCGHIAECDCTDGVTL